MNYEMRSAEAVSSFSGHYQSSSIADEVLTAPPAPKKRRVKVKVVEPVQALEPEAKALEALVPGQVFVPEAEALEPEAEAAAETERRAKNIFRHMVVVDYIPGGKRRVFNTLSIKLQRRPSFWTTRLFNTCPKKRRTSLCFPLDI